MTLTAWTRALVLAAMLAGASACSNGFNLPSIPGLGGGDNEEEEVEQTGRISLTLEAEQLAADPNMASVAIILPDPVPLTSWGQAGSRPSKVVGHVAAAREFEIDWRVSAVQGTNRSSALTTAPVSDGDAIYVLDADQAVSAFNIENGRRLWRERLRSDTKGDRASVGGGIAVEGGKVIVASGYGFVVALSTENGEEIWRRRTTAPMTGSPTIKDGNVFVASQNNEILAIDLQTGTINWSDQAISEDARVLASPSPAAIENLVVAPFSSGEVIAYLNANGRRLWVDALAAASQLTPISSINDIPARPVLSLGVVFASAQSGVTAAIDGQTGTRIWTQSIGSVQAPAIAGEFLFIAGVDGKVACLDRNTGAVVWVNQLQQFRKEKDKKGRVSYAGPIIASGQIVVANSLGELLALSPQTGQVEKTLKLGGEVFLEPISVGDKLFVLADNGRLIAIR
ncbi:MAG: PQQ-binding-like beta-propeller repeat protein [Pseudomonadota bacterium]